MTESSLQVENIIEPIVHVGVPQKTDYTGKFITLSPVNPQTDVVELYSLNERSRSAALRLGFKFEGIFRQHMIIKGRNRDTTWYSMLDSEWTAVKKNMEVWLYHNPDQRLSLTTLNTN